MRADQETARGQRANRLCRTASVWIWVLLAGTALAWAVPLVARSPDATAFQLQAYTTTWLPTALGLAWLAVRVSRGRGLKAGLVATGALGLLLTAVLLGIVLVAPATEAQPLGGLAVVTGSSTVGVFQALVRALAAI